PGTFRCCKRIEPRNDFYGILSCKCTESENCSRRINRKSSSAFSDSCIANLRIATRQDKKCKEIAFHFRCDSSFRIINSVTWDNLFRGYLIDDGRILSCGGPDDRIRRCEKSSSRGT